MNNERFNPSRINRRYLGLRNLRLVMERTIAQYVQPLAALRQPINILDYGCGSMPYRALFDSLAVRYCGADIVENSAAEVYIDAQTGHVAIASQWADLVISTQVLEHVESPSDYLREAWRLCRPGGLLIISTHGFWPYHPNPNDYWRWTPSGLEKLLQLCGWKVIELTGVVGLAATSACLFQDAIEGKLHPVLRKPFTIFMQHTAALLDRFDSADARKLNAAVYIIVAQSIPKATP